MAPLSKAYAISERYCSGKPPDGFATAPLPNTSAISVQYCSGKSDRLPQPKQVPPCTFDDFVDWAAHQTIFSVGCNSDSETLASFQTVETVLSYPNEDIVLTPISSDVLR